MRDLNAKMIDKYQGNFLAEVIDNVEEGEMLQMCMQCGVCSGSCPLGPQGAWEYPPSELFMMVRAGKREEVLGTSSMWMCTSCYNCIARCPRKLPITHLMHGLAHYAKKLGLAPKNQATKKFGVLFWNNLGKKGRINELKLGINLYFVDGFAQGIKNAIKASSLGLGMLKAKRLNLLEFFGGHSVKDSSGLAKILKKAQELEDARILGDK